METEPSPRHRLAALRSAVRRRMLRHRRLLAALATGVTVLAGLQVLRPEAPATVSVWVAARDLAPGTVVVADDLVRAAWDPGSVPDHAVDDPVGETVAGPVRRGEPLTDVRLVGPDLVAAHPGTVALPVRIADAGVVALLQVGDRVDVFAASATGGEDAALVGERLPVIGLPAEAEAPGGLSGAPPGRLVLLAVDPATAGVIAGRAAWSTLLVTISR